jgi:hypothetical protein
MKSLRVLSLLLVFSLSFSGLTQIFYFEDTETTLVKETNQSPVHWYVEIFSNIQLDSVLRWKADFVNIPNEWNINFDCQSISFPTVEHNDSADFVFWSEPEFPQKLIIGAMLNDTPGNGSVYFDVYDPYNREEVERIAFHFFISLSANASLVESDLSSVISLENGVLHNISTTHLSCSIFDNEGKTIHKTNVFNKEIDLSARKGELLFIHLIDQKNNQYYLKIIL